MSNLSFFDHQCIQVTQTSIKVPVRSPVKYPLRLLIASECENTTAHSLATALSQFPELMYLDISGAQGSRSPYVLHQIGCLTGLKVLKLRNCGLRDEDLEYLKFGKKLRSLDVSYNFLTERGISRLLEMIPSEIMVPGRELLNARNASSLAQRSSGLPLQYRVLAEGLESFILHRLTSSVDAHHQVDEGLPSVFTNLHVASNYLTIDGLSRVIQHSTLRNVDFGSLNLSERPYELISPRSPASSGSRRFSDPPEAEMLSPALFCESFRNLSSIRINHSVITSCPFSGKELPISEQCFELHSEDLRFELDSKEVRIPGTYFEMEDTSKSITPEPEPEIEIGPLDEIRPEVSDEKEAVEEEESHATFESPEDVQNTFDTEKTNPIEIKGSDSSVENSPSVSRKAAPPRISISMQHMNGPTSHPVQLSGSLPDGPERFRYNYKAGPESPWRALEQRPQPSGIRELIEEITQRQHRVAARERHPGRFKPSMLPNLKTLILTDVPSTTRRRHIPDTLAHFIQECAEDEELARLEAIANYRTVGKGQISPPPVLKLQTLMLEMTCKPEPAYIPRSPRRSPRPSFTKSSTEDPDSELFMNNSESDFSFFGEDDGGLLVSEGRVDRPLHYDEGLMLDVDDGHLIDTIAELASFRRQKKRRFETLERLMASGCEHLEMEVAFLGHWRGEVKVVR